MVASAVVLVAGLGVVGILRGGEEEGGSPLGGASDRSNLLALAVLTDAEPMVAVLGTGGGLPPSALVVPASVFLTIPGHGDGTVGRAAGLPGRTFATALSNLLGTWVEHYAVTDMEGLAQSMDRLGGVRVGDQRVSGRTAAGYLGGTEGSTLWGEVLRGWLDAGPSVMAADFRELDDEAAAAEIVGGARDVTVAQLPTVEAESGFLLPAASGMRLVLERRFGIAPRPQVPVVVLNGSGAPGVGERVAERLIPAGFQIVVSENAASFDNATTAIVVSDGGSREVAQQVRGLLGVGEISAGPSSNLSDVTIVVGEDFTSG